MEKQKKSARKSPYPYKLEDLKKIKGDSKFFYPYKLNLGCGRVYLNGWINSDLGDNNCMGEKIKIDKILDVNKYPYDLKDNSVDEVLCEDLIEKIEDLDKFLNELNRIMVVGGKAHIRVAYYAYWGIYAEVHTTPLHRFCIRCCNLFTIMKNNGFELVEKKAWNCNKYLNLFCPLINISDLTQGIYERFFANIFPVSHVKWQIKKVRDCERKKEWVSYDSLKVKNS